jgi:hypothetical protein
MTDGGECGRPTCGCRAVLHSVPFFLILNLDSADNRCGEVRAARATCRAEPRSAPLFLILNLGSDDYRCGGVSVPRSGL